MKGKFFLDTNIFVYTFDQSALKKQERAKKLVANALDKQLGVISYQVIQEFLNVAMRKFAVPLSSHEVNLYLEQVLTPLCEYYPTADFYQNALLLQKDIQFSFYDTLIVTAALKTHCTILYSEDLQDGREIAGLTIKNPFR
ncbi:MAG TPA: PIN domain-containing protein [Gammaproteobacteria bacterium]|nr:PIN domain-containing protein [Gammaproteobacteria bacterium]